VYRLICVLAIVTAFCTLPVSVASGEPLTPAAAGQKAPLPLPEFAGKAWLLSDLRPSQFIQYHTHDESGFLGFSGMDSDGNVIEGHVFFDPVSLQTTLISVRKGVLSEFEVTARPDGSIVMAGREDGAEIRQIFERVGTTRYTVRFEERRNGQWVRLRSYNLFPAIPGMLKALQWVERDPAAEKEAAAAREALLRNQQSFLSRLSKAIQDGIVEGAKDGVKVGVHDWTYSQVTNTDMTPAKPAAAE